MNFRDGLSEGFFIAQEMLAVHIAFPDGVKAESRIGAESFHIPAIYQQMDAPVSPAA